MYLNQYTALALPEEAIRQSNNNSHFSPGTSLSNEANSVYQQFFTDFPITEDLGEEQIEWLEERAEKWRGLITSIYSDQLKGRANFVPVTVAGPARYNYSKFEKIAERNFKNAAEGQEKIKKFLRNTQSGLASRRPIEKTLAGLRKGRYHKEVIESNDPHAVAKLQAKMECLEGHQVLMKEANAHWRKHGTMKGFKNLTDEQAEKDDEGIMSSHFAKKVAYPSYCLTNNNASIRAIKERIKSLEAHQEEGAFEDVEFDGGKVIGNAEASRLQFLFDDLPEDDLRTKLKANGFKWAPSQKAWQRQWTANGERAVRTILGYLVGATEV
ncbi:MAG: hypothetical protein R3Y55_03765 [Rikenellaceae bacterium]